LLNNISVNKNKAFMSKKSVHKLSSEADTIVTLLGISSHENDYRISWALNEHLGFRFTKTENHKVLNQRLKQSQEFSTYQFMNNDDSYRLISNRCDNGFLIEELKNIDFLLVIEENKTLISVQELIKRIKDIPFISAVFPIEISSLKKNYLAF
jgi:hypothetical protein